MNASLDTKASGSSPMIDPFGRTISYLRVSVTDRCDLRCFYCMSEDMTFLPRSDLLTLEELDRLCSAFIAKGVRKLRLTGGEPLVRRNVMSLFRSLSRHLQSGALVSLLDPLRPQEEPIWAVYPQRRHLLPKVRLLIDKLREELPGALRRSG